MSSKPLSVKYRPKKLADVVGQDVIVRTLTNSFKSNNWHHAYLLEGCYGTGKTTIARIMAAMDNNPSGRSLEPDADTDICKAIFNGKSFDVKEIDAASNRGIDEIRAIKKESQNAPTQCRMKYYVVDECHSLSGIAAEAMLKFIEEPPPNVRILLCTTDAHLLKDTIHSRCFKLSFSKVKWNDIFSNLKNISSSEKIDIGDDVLKFISRSSDGSVRNSLQNLQSVISYAGNEAVSIEHAQKALCSIDQSLYMDLMDSMINIEIAQSMEIVDKLLVTGKNSNNIIKGMTNYLRNLMLAKATYEKISELGFTEEEAKKMLHQAEKIDMLIIFNMMKGLVEVQQAISVNLDLQIFLEKYVLNSIKDIVRLKK